MSPLRPATPLPVGLFAAVALLFFVAHADPAVSVNYNIDKVLNDTNRSTTFTAAAFPFPSDIYARPAPHNLTGIHVNLPFPNCSVYVSDCQDVALLNTLDGFSLLPRIAIPFTRPIDLTTASSDNIFLLNLGNPTTTSTSMAAHTPQAAAKIVRINQRLWDPNTTTLYFKPNDMLAERTLYAIVVTDAVRDLEHKQPIHLTIPAVPSSDHPFHSYQSTWQQAQALTAKLLAPQNLPVNFAVVSVFTTMSYSTDLFKIMRQIKRSCPSPVNFNRATSNAGMPARAIFTLNETLAFYFLREVNTSGTLQPQPVPLGLLESTQSVHAVAYGEYSSPNYLQKGQFIPSSPSASGMPQPQGTTNITVQIFIPNGNMPPGGWPVTIFGHAFGDSLYGYPWVAANALASGGIATLVINSVGHGGGRNGKLVVSTKSNGNLTLPAGGRGMDLNGDGVISPTEGIQALPPYGLAGFRDTLRQTAVDIMQLVRHVQCGIDYDGDGKVDLSQVRINYGGVSLGAIIGTTVMGVDPSIRAGLLNVGGGSLTDVARLGFFRPTIGSFLLTRVPTILNLPPVPNATTPGLNFDENIPLRDLPVVVNNVPGALKLWEFLDRGDWFGQPGNPVAYAHLLRLSPPAGFSSKRVLIQIAKGDMTVPNPTNTALIRAGDLANVTTYFRDDLVKPRNLSHNPHNFLLDVIEPAWAPYALMAEKQFVTFIVTDGVTIINPDTDFFEVPIRPPLPETLNF